MAKPVIAVDIDDVLSASAEAFVAFSNERYGTNLKPEDYQEHWGKLWKTDLEETTRRAAEFDNLRSTIHHHHFDEAKPVLTKLAKRYQLIIITSRRISLETWTRDWVKQCYGDIFSDIQFAGIFDGPIHLGMLAQTKADLFASNDVRYVIDDQLKHCLAAADLEIKAVLFGDYPWNRTDNLPKGVTRCIDWPAVLEYFDEQS